ncbi:MAG: AAA family ATPase, partial [Candidatus Omnitrophica bacterium]|nr:AAA family ATPase [Candidatus Omnitrophota bacterium]
IRDKYDYILIDCPPSLGILTVNSIRVSDEVMVPVETSRFSMQGVDHIMDIINLIRERLNHQVKCKILITMFDSRLRHSFSMLGAFKEKFGTLLYDTIIHVNVKLKESVVIGKTVAAFDKYCRGSKDYNSLSKELIFLDSQNEEMQALKRERSIFRPLSDKMKETVKTESKQFCVTRFAIEAPEARTVYVTGSFNDWSLNDTCRLNPSNGKWVVDIPLNPGVYEYQFIVDGVWKEDPVNCRKERNPYGDDNSLIEVTIDQALNV